MRQSWVSYCGVKRLAWVAVWSLLSAPLFAQVSGDFTDANLTDMERRETALLWLDTFLTESDLLRADDLTKIREAVAQMSPSQLRQWLEQTNQLRDYVEGEKWQQTKRWLRELLRVQVIYSEQELQRLRDEIVRADADQMLAILKRIQARHDVLVWMHQAADRNRQVEVQERDAHLAQQAALAQAARTPPAPGVAIPAAPEAGAGQRPSKGYQAPSPLVTSREMARAAVWSELWGPGVIFGF